MVWPRGLQEVSSRHLRLQRERSLSRRRPLGRGYSSIPWLQTSSSGKLDVGIILCDQSLTALSNPSILKVFRSEVQIDWHPLPLWRKLRICNLCQRSSQLERYRFSLLCILICPWQLLVWPRRGGDSLSLLEHAVLRTDCYIPRR